MTLVAIAMKQPPALSRGKPSATPAEPSLTPVVLLTPADVASLLRTTRRAVYAMLERGQLPGIIRIGRRVLVRQDDLLNWLDQKRTPSPEELQR